MTLAAPIKRRTFQPLPAPEASRTAWNEDLFSSITVLTKNHEGFR